MSRLDITSESRVYRVSPDFAVAPANRLRAFVAGQLIDEVTNNAPSGHVKIEVREKGLVLKVSPDSIFSVAGIPLQQFSFLATQNYPIHLRVAAPGYIPLVLTITIPKTPAFPNQLPALADLKKVFLHRESVLIAGRVVQNTPTSAPIAGATVRLTGVWPALPGPSVALPPADPPNLISIRGPLYTGRSVATGKARAVTLSPTTDPSKTLTAAVSSGEKRLMLDNRVGLTLTGGDVLVIDSGISTQEFVKTTLVRGASTADQPAEVILAAAVSNSHPQGATIRRVNPASPGADKALTRAAIAGDPVLFVSNLAGWDTAAAIEVLNSGAPPSNEYHAFSLFTVTTNADGFYRMPPISRVAILKLQAQGPTTAEITQTIDYTEPINYADFRL